uniref:Odorant-binding protein 11 n=1 Tax=Adelphocoris fasciaticollis TaxID=323752 RepID=A0A172MAH5_9HEMI|nr:putative odorant binding protein 11 [Adelphocoris fasciaticollis]AOO79091.1 odorant-binding protein 11 [Adelphocoris fasciaticollis]
MKTFVGLIFAVALVEFASAISKEYHDKAVAARTTCAKLHNVDDKTIMEHWKNHQLPEKEPETCIIICYLKEMKLVVDGKVDADAWKASNKEKWDDEKHVAAADEIVDKCSAEVPPTENECEWGLALTKCGLKHGKEAGIPPPDMEHPKRR